MLALLEQNAVWAKGRETEKSVHLAFALTAEGDGEYPKTEGEDADKDASE